MTLQIPNLLHINTSCPFTALIEPLLNLYLAPHHLPLTACAKLNLMVQEEE